ncbi:MAG: Cys-Gln thioester bond-forming surface protein, partial [Clostridia bacterium]|nr:Cys-Gln thioester bond-forming surface protein [Clostridia bacterium]
MKSKKIVAIIIAFIMIFSYISPVIAVSKTSFTVKRSAERDGYQYWINGKRVNKFTVSGYGAAYCLKADANFNEKSYSYNRSYNMKTEVKAIKGVDWKSSELTHTKKEVGIKRTYEKTDSGAYAYTRPKLTVNESGTGVTYCNYNAVLWLLDNMYIPVSSSTKNKEFKKQLYEEVFATAIEKHNFKVSSVKLTDEDIQVVQQWAIWYFTNSEESKYHVTTLPTVKVKNSSGGTLHTINSLGETGRNQKYMNALYVYLIENAMRNAKDY